MPLTQSDRQLLVRCIEGQPFAWHTFVDRFIGLMMLVWVYSLTLLLGGELAQRVAQRGADGAAASASPASASAAD